MTSFLASVYDYVVALSKLPLRKWATILAFTIVSVGAVLVAASKSAGVVLPAFVAAIVGVASAFLQSPFADPTVNQTLEGRRAARVLRTAGVDPKTAPKDPDETPDETPKKS